jgi:hypothetical protein
MKGPAKLLSGAQTGADRAALDWAIFHDIPHGGWCPKGRRAEDGKIPPQYQLTETPSASYLQTLTSMCPVAGVGSGLGSEGPK